MRKNDIVELFTSEGEVVSYHSLAARLPGFLAVYGPDKGYAVETELMDFLSLKSSFLKVLESLQVLDVKIADLGALLGASAQMLVCCATLRNAEGHIVVTATAAKAILAYKDVEILETAARQRLLAALGFGGEVILADEQQDGRDQAMTLHPVEPVAPIQVEPIAPALVASTLITPVRVSAEEMVLSAVASPRDVETLDHLASPAVASPAHANEPMAVTTVEAATPPVAAAEEKALGLLRQQIAALAALQGIEPPPITTRDEGRNVLKQLITAR